MNQLQAVSPQKLWLVHPKVLSLAVQFMADASVLGTRKCNFNGNGHNFNVQINCKFNTLRISDLEKCQIELNEHEYQLTFIVNQRKYKSTSTAN
jgi:hypothetical protein